MSDKHRGKKYRWSTVDQPLSRYMVDRSFLVDFDIDL